MYRTVLKRTGPLQRHSRWTPRRTMAQPLSDWESEVFRFQLQNKLISVHRNKLGAIQTRSSGLSASASPPDCSLIRAIGGTGAHRLTVAAAEFRGVAPRGAKVSAHLLRHRFRSGPGRSQGSCCRVFVVRVGTGGPSPWHNASSIQRKGVGDHLRGHMCYERTPCSLWLTANGPSR